MPYDPPESPQLLFESYSPPATDSVSVEFSGDPQPPTIVELESVDGRRATIAWEGYDDAADTFAILVRAAGASEWTEDGTAPAADGGRQTYETTALLDGQPYDVAVRVTDVYGNSATSSTASELFETGLPDAQGLSLDGTPSSELIAAWGDVLNNGQYRLEYRDDDPDGVEGSGVWGEGLYGEGLYSPYPGYHLETTIPHDGTLEHTIEDVLDGEQFSVRIRTETEHATGGWLTAEEITKLYSPGPPTFTAVSETEVGLEWTNNSLFEGSNQIYRRRVYGNDSVGQWRLVGSVGDAETSYTDTGPRPDTEYEYRVTALSQWVSSDGDGGTTTTDDIGLSHRSVPPRGWHVEVDADGTPFTSEILSDGTQFQPTLNGQPTATINVPRDEAYLLEQFEGAPMQVWKDGERRAVDELEDVVIETDRDELVGYGGTELEQDVRADVDEQPAHELVAELIDEHTDMVPNIDAPDGRTIEDVVIVDVGGEEGLRELFEPTIDETDPVTFQPDGITMVESSFLLEGEEYDSTSGADTSVIEDDSHSGGEGVEISGLVDQSVTWEFSTDYVMPADALEIQVRDGPMTNAPDLRVEIDGVEVGTIPGGDSSEVEWYPPSLDSLEDLDAGSHDISLVIDSDADGEYVVDCLAVYDDRFSYTFDDEVDEQADGNHELSGPEPMPDEVTITTDELVAVAAIDTARIIPDIFAGADGPEIVSRIQARFGRQDWQPDDGSGEDVEEIEITNSGELSVRIDARVTLRRYGEFAGTPTDGREGQDLDEIRIEADLDTTPLVINQTYKGDLGADVLTPIADQAEAVYEVWQSGDETMFEWTYPGQREASRADAISDYSVTKHNRRTLKCTVEAANSSATETIEVDIGTPVDLDEDALVRGKVNVQTDDGDQLRPGFDYELDAADGRVTILDNDLVDTGDDVTVEFDHTITGEWEHDEFDGDQRQAATEQIPAARSERAAEQAARLIVEENSIPRWVVEFTIAYEDAQDLRLTDTLDLEGVPGEAEVVYDITDQGIESGLQGRLGNRSQVSETVSQIQSTLSSASDLV